MNVISSPNTILSPSHIQVMTSALINRTDESIRNLSHQFHVTTASMMSDNVTQCSWNSSLNQSICEAIATTVASPVNSTDKVNTGLPLSLWLTIFLGILAGIISIVTVLGNLTVLLAFGLERSIRQPTNYFLASLAVSDLLIGTFSMPLFTQYILLDEWWLGPWLCDLWLSLDWTVCLTSQYTVFFITMDRFLSVKIPAKYRNWRTERKVLIMIAITWVLPTLVFFTSIIGWQYFVGERTVKETTCEVQFMNDPLFTFVLTIGYYWITLVVMCILYAGIYKVALDLQRKSDAKHKKLQSTMELAADHSAARNTASNSSDSAMQGAPTANNVKTKKKSLKNLVSVGLAADKNNVSKKNVNTTSFGGRNKLNTMDIGRHGSLGGGSTATDMGDNKDEDRSSSPAFASDEENSSSGAGTGGGGSVSNRSPNTGKSKSGSSRNNVRQSSQTSPSPKSGIAGIVNTAMLSQRDSVQPANNSAVKSDVTFSEQVGTPMPPKGQFLRPNHGGPNYSRLEPHLDAADPDWSGQDIDSLYSSSASDRLERSTIPLIDQDISRGSRYIDEKSFLSQNLPLLPSLPGTETAVKDNGGEEDSPLWKRRNSLPLPPLATDIFDIIIDDDFTDYGVTEVTMSTVLNSSHRANGEDVHFTAELSSSAMEGDLPAERSHVSQQAQGDEQQVDNDPQHLSTHRRREKGDGKIHSFVKSVRSRNSRRRNRRERKSKSENRARKALRTITIILGAFVLCWTPYHIMLFVIAIYNTTEYISIAFYNFTYWLCYLNSPINPFCYAFANVQFKRTFLRILRFDWHRT